MLHAEALLMTNCSSCLGFTKVNAVKELERRAFAPICYLDCDLQRLSLRGFSQLQTHSPSLASYRVSLSCPTVEPLANVVPSTSRSDSRGSRLLLRATLLATFWGLELRSEGAHGLMIWPHRLESLTQTEFSWDFLFSNLTTLFSGTYH